MDYYTVRTLAGTMGIGEYYRYLPLLFTYRTINTTKPLGGRPVKEERNYLVNNDEVNMEKIGGLLQKLPTDLVFIFKAMHIIGVHNMRCGGNTRERILNFTDYSIQAIGQNYSMVYQRWLKIMFWFKLFLFENCFWLYERMYGFLRVGGSSEIGNDLTEIAPPAGQTYAEK